MPASDFTVFSKSGIIPPMQRYGLIVIFAFAVGCTPVVEDFESLDAHEQARLHNPSTQPEPQPKPSYFDTREFVKNALLATFVIGVGVCVAIIAVGYFVLLSIYQSGQFPFAAFVR